MSLQGGAPAATESHRRTRFRNGLHLVGDLAGLGRVAFELVEQALRDDERSAKRSSGVVVKVDFEV